MRKRTQQFNGRNSNNNNNNGNSGGRSHGQNRRGGRNNNGGNGNNTSNDPNFIQPRQRSSAITNRDKYLNQSRDARASGDRVKAEYYLQHADHYIRIIDMADEQHAARQAERDAAQAAQQKDNADKAEKADGESDVKAKDDAVDEGTEKAAESEEKPRATRTRTRRPAVKKDAPVEAEPVTSLEAVLPAAKQPEEEIA